MWFFLLFWAVHVVYILDNSLRLLRWSKVSFYWLKLSNKVLLSWRSSMSLKSCPRQGALKKMAKLLGVGNDLTVKPVLTFETTATSLKCFEGLLRYPLSLWSQTELFWRLFSTRRLLLINLDGNILPCSVTSVLDWAATDVLPNHISSLFHLEKHTQMKPVATIVIHLYIVRYLTIPVTSFVGLTSLGYSVSTNHNCLAFKLFLIILFIYTTTCALQAVRKNSWSLIG